MSCRLVRREQQPLSYPCRPVYNNPTIGQVLSRTRLVEWLRMTTTLTCHLVGSGVLVWERTSAKIPRRVPTTTRKGRLCPVQILGPPLLSQSPRDRGHPLRRTWRVEIHLEACLRPVWLPRELLQRLLATLPGLQHLGLSDLAAMGRLTTSRWCLLCQSWVTTGGASRKVEAAAEEAVAQERRGTAIEQHTSLPAVLGGIGRSQEASESENRTRPYSFGNSFRCRCFTQLVLY
jgi:hypothetical protein